MTAFHKSLSLSAFLSSGPALEFESLCLIITVREAAFLCYASPEITALLSDAFGALRKKTCTVFRLLAGHSRPTQVHFGLDFGSRKPSLWTVLQTHCHEDCSASVHFSSVASATSDNQALEMWLVKPRNCILNCS